VLENEENENTKLKAVDINLSFIPTYGIDVDRIIAANNKVLIYDDNKGKINELYQGNNVYIVIETNENKMYDRNVDFDNVKLVVFISYYDVELDKQTDLLLNSSFTSENNEQLELIIRNIKSGNRKIIEPCMKLQL
jgi:hypothetical protein